MLFSSCGAKWLKRFTRSMLMCEYCSAIAPEAAPLTNSWMLSVILYAVHSGQDYRKMARAPSLLGNPIFRGGRHSMPLLSTKAASGSFRNDPGWIRRASLSVRVVFLNGWRSSHQGTMA